jgi:hypothetical protein
MKEARKAKERKEQSKSQAKKTTGLNGMLRSWNQTAPTQQREAREYIGKEEKQGLREGTRKSSIGMPSLLISTDMNLSELTSRNQSRTFGSVCCRD